MGNRVYITVKSEIEAKTFYLHWNGGLDTWCPISKVLFDNDVRSVDKVVAFSKAVGFRMEEQENAEARNWLEENGHFYIDLDRKTLLQKYEDPINGQTLTRWVPHLREGFDAYVSKYIIKSHQAAVSKEYWDGILELGTMFFKTNGGQK